MLNPPGFPSGGGTSSPSSKKKLQIQGTRPPRLRVSSESHTIRKPPLPPAAYYRLPAAASQDRQPLIIYSVSPKVHHVAVSDFMNVVQHLTGPSSGEETPLRSGDVSLAARLASIENTNPSEKERVQSVDDDLTWLLEGVEMGQFPGILSPATLPPISPGFFSPVIEPQTTSFWNELGPFWSANSFVVSPSGLLSAAVVSPLPSPDLYRFGGCGAHLEEKSAAEDEVSNRSELWRLIKIRDFISLLLSYPVKLAEEEKDVLKAWTNAFPEWKAQLLSNIDHSVTNDDEPWHVLTQKALGCMTGLIPMEMISKLESCEIGRSFFNYDDLIPPTILPLSIDLAVEQLIQTLFSGDDYACNIRYVKLSTSDVSEKRSMVKKIEASLEDKHNLFGIDKMFVRALWIDASIYEGDVKVRVQDEINRMMVGVKENMAGDNRYLVILVDADNGKKMDPREVCFPAGTMVLITTETLALTEEDDEFTITCSMDLNISTQDHLLPWKTFCSYAGISTVSFLTPIPVIAAQIVKECCGHLLAIVLVAKLLNHVEDVKLWELALEKLRYTNPSFDYQESDGIGISRVMVNAFVNIVWEGINKRLKLFLELSLFVQKIKIGVPRVTLSNSVCSTDIELNYTREDVEDLLDLSVFLPCESGNVRLPVESYYIIESLHTSNPSVIKHGALGLTEPPYVGRWHHLIRIELVDNKISELPESPDFPKLQALLLRGNADLMDIPDTFFDHMSVLQHLDLSYTCIRGLPSSISKLRELRRFYLKGCDLFMELPQSIGQLTNLEELDLDGTLITHLPEEIRELINLQRLTLCFDVDVYYSHVEKGKQISNSMIIPPLVISNLINLNHLSINVDPEDDRWNENVENILLEIFGLEKLQIVSIYVPKAELLKLMPAQKSLDLRLVVGHHVKRFISRAPPKVEEKFKQLGRSIKFVNVVDVPNGAKMNLEHYLALYLDRHMTIRTLSEFHVKDLDMLLICILGECNEMETIVDGSYPFALSNLEFLNVYYMKNLRSICEGTVFLGSLKFIALHTCPMLTTIFTLSFVGNLSLLEELVVEDCPKVTTLISLNSSTHGAHIFLPRLRKITLVYLPKLVNIFNGLQAGKGLQEIGFYYCPKLQILSKKELLSKGLRVIKGESRWWEALKWNEGGWGDAGRPHFLNQMFSPINEELDIMTQLAAYDYEYQADTMTQPAPHNEEVQVRVKSEKGPQKTQLAAHKEEVKVPVKAEESFDDDGHSWRKYGQKEILGAKYPRVYYRCTFQKTYGCPAKKQVQRSDEDPTMSIVTYRGIHTCQKVDVMTQVAAHDEEEQGEIKRGVSLLEKARPPPLLSSWTTSKKQKLRTTATISYNVPSSDFRTFVESLTTGQPSENVDTSVHEEEMEPDKVDMSVLTEDLGEMEVD